MADMKFTPGNSDLHICTTAAGYFMLVDFQCYCYDRDGAMFFDKEAIVDIARELNCEPDGKFETFLQDLVNMALHPRKVATMAAKCPTYADLGDPNGKTANAKWIATMMQRKIDIDRMWLSPGPAGLAGQVGPKSDESSFRVFDFSINPRCAVQ